MSRKPDFELSKWYLDCVSDEGEAAIGYLAELRWNSVTLHYQSLLLSSESQGSESRSSLRKSPPPVLRRNLLEWKSPALKIEGVWDALEGPVEATVLQSDAGNVVWRCLQPRAKAAIRVDGKREMRGLGYAEHLRLTIPPWKLPLKELRWGRFLSGKESLVWIDWRGAHARQLVFHNGAAVHAECISDVEVGLDGSEATLHLENPVVLRKGTLSETALSILPSLHKLFPAQILGVRECKWRSRGRLCCKGAPDALGWVIHEVVEWP